MRADRLVAILMLLQSRGPITAAALARALEVSVRTIYRDMDALSAAGVPVYAERGPTGGCRLVENYRTDLTGLTEDEAAALALLVAPGPLDTLEVGRKLKAALRKLYAARIGPPGRHENAGPCVHLDWTWWGQGEAVGSSLDTLYRAVAERCRVRVGYRLSNGIQVSQVVDPLGLVGKAGAWYLVHSAHGKIDHHTLDELEVECLPETFAYPAGFDLAVYWETACANIEAARTAFKVVVRAPPALLPVLRRLFGRHAVLERPAAGPGLEVELGCANLVEARSRLLGLGGAVEVLEPPALRLSMADYARQIAGVYR